MRGVEHFGDVADRRPAVRPPRIVETPATSIEHELALSSRKAAASPTS